MTLTVTDEQGAFNSITKTVKVVPIWRKEIRVGDILFDKNFWGGIGHVGIYYLADITIEAQRSGVRMSSIQTWDNRESAWLFRVKCSDEVAKTAAQFVYNQIGKNYSYMYVQKSSDPNSQDWYCSELVWAAYKNAGNLDLEYAPDPWAVSPLEIFLEASEGEKLYIVSSHGDIPNIALYKPWMVLALCPVDIVISDPEGLTISKDQNQVDNAIYIVDDFNEDGIPDKAIGVQERKIGNYSITVVQNLPLNLPIHIASRC